MTAEKSIAIVLRVVDFSETSAVVTMMTRDFGKITALAKGARRPKGPFEAALDVLSICRVVFLRKSGDSLHLLTEAKLERRFRTASTDLSRLYAAYYVAELLNKLTDDLDLHIELFDLAEDTLTRLDQDHSSEDGLSERLLLRFQLRSLDLLGHMPSFDQCVECGKPAATENESGKRIPFGLDSGGVFCTRCRVGKRFIVSLSRDAATVLTQYSNPDDNWSENLKSNPPMGEMRGLIDQYLTYLLGKKPRMVEFLQGKQSFRKSVR